ncbi:MAG: tyrosine-type recombinase/integrase, partial [Lachnospiraceae bacterium]|nr:tyrosine-type recombinase/integrase [Lachnospiraceae bacterium]
PHVIRHTTATTAIRNGMPVEDISKLLGHSNIDTTMIYYGKKNLMTSCTDGSAYLQRYPPEQLSIINASDH